MSIKKAIISIAVLTGVIVLGVKLFAEKEPEPPPPRLFIEAPRMPVMPEIALYGVNIPYELYVIIRAESNFDPEAINHKYGERGGMGLAQLIPSTVKHCEKKLGKEIDPYNLVDNLECANYLFETDGNRHWGYPKDDPRGYINGVRWGSYDNWIEEL